MKRKIFTLLFAFIISVGTNFATVYSGFCGADGDNLTWSLNTEDSTLVIEGSGAMRDYSWDSYAWKIDAPWYEYRDNIGSILFSNEQTTIGEWAFFRCGNIKSIAIPKSVMSIGMNAFAEAYRLSSVHICDLTAWCNISFADNPLYNARHLYLNGIEIKDLVIPDDVTNISDCAFEYCEGLTSVTIPNNVITIGNRTFWTCTNIKNISVGNGVKIIGSQSFSCCSNLTNIIIGDSVATIGDKAFENCNNLVSVTLNANAICSADHVKMDGIHKIFGVQVKEYIIGESVNRIGNSLCSSCTDLTNVIIGNNVTTIGDNAFAYCTSLANATIGNNVTIIGNSAFAGCTNLTNVIMGNRVTEMGDFAFNCGITSIILPESLTKVGTNVFSFSSLTSIKIPKSLTYIGQAMFYGCKRLKEITFHNDITRIYASAFYKCDSLNNIVIPNSVTEIGDFAFAECKNLSNITLSNYLNSIGNYVFYSCDRLPEIDIPNSVRFIGENAFKYCRNLKKATLGNNVDSISSSAFANCGQLLSINIPDRVYTIGTRAFYLCRSLTHVDIPQSVISIGEEAFFACSNLQIITCLGEIPARLEGSNVFFGCSNLTIHVPCGALEAYQASAWNAYPLQYAPGEYDLQTQVKDNIGGSVQTENTICASSITAIPDEGYNFDHWLDGNTDNPRIITLTQDSSFTAIFAIQKFTITFVDDNDTILSVQEVEYNTMPVLPDDPVKQGNAQYSYTFAGWSPTIVPATKDAIYKATYNRTTNQYTITFLNDDNSVLSSKLWDYGATPTCEQPSKEEDEEYTYTFKDWYPEIVPVVADATYTATYTAKKKTEGCEDVFLEGKPQKVLEKGTIYLLMPNGQKYSIIGNQIK